MLLNIIIMFCYCSYLALESMCLLAASEFSHDAVKKHQDTVIAALKVGHKDVVSFSSDLIIYARFYQLGLNL